MSLKTKAAYNSQMPFTFHEKLNSNQFIITTEISPPKGVNPASTLDDAEFVREYMQISIENQQSFLLLRCQSLL